MASLHHSRAWILALLAGWATCQSASWAGGTANWGFREPGAQAPLTPLQDWLMQDLGLESAKVWQESRGDLTLAAKLLQAPLQEIAGKVPAQLQSRVDELLSQTPPVSDPRWLSCYQELCQIRRALRLAGMNRQSPRVIFLKHRTILPSFIGYTEGLSDAQAERHFLPDTELCMLELSGTQTQVTTLLKDPNGVIRDPVLSWDGKSVAFAWKKSDRLDDYHIYEMDLATRRTRQITFGLGCADFEPAYLPNDDLVFSSSRCVQQVPCWVVEVSNLYTCDRQGRFLRRLGFDQVHTIKPEVLDDGRVTFTRWDYNDRGQMFPHGLMQMNPDGTAQSELYGMNSWFPTSLLHPRGIPGTNQILCIFSGHHSPQTGKLGLVDTSKGRQENTGAQLAAPLRQTAADRIDAYGQTGELFRHPYPLSQRECLVAYTPVGWEKVGPGGNHKFGGFGIYWMDFTDGRRELLTADERIPCQQPISMTPRRRPPEKASQVDYAREDGTFFVQDIYAGQSLNGIQRGEVKRLRVVALDYRPAEMGCNSSGGPGGGARVSTPVSIGSGSWDAKVILGDAKVHDDGSVYFKAPARVPLYFQALDEKGRMLQTMRTWTVLMPGENASCIGCHEDKNAAPAVNLSRKPQALAAGAQDLAPFFGPTRGFSFTREIQPILDQHCIRCHNDREPVLARDKQVVGHVLGLKHEATILKAAGPEKAFSLMSAGIVDASAKRTWSDAYLMLTHAFRQGDAKNLNAAYHGLTTDPVVNWPGTQSVVELLPPKFSGSIKSRLIAMLESGHGGVKLSAAELEKICTWIDLYVPFCGDFAEANTWSPKEKERFAHFVAKRQALGAQDKKANGEFLAIQQSKASAAQSLKLEAQILSDQGKMLTGKKAEASPDAPMVLVLDRGLQAGEKLRLQLELPVTPETPVYLKISLDKAIGEELICLTGPVLEWSVPGAWKKALPREAFAANVPATLEIRPVRLSDLDAYRNLAVNRYDPMGQSGFYPHASSNSECRNDPVFAARNVIDGSLENKHHGAWPNQSWGPDKIPDAWLQVDFGRAVELDKVVIYLRADFPHDKTWKSAELVLEGGYRQTIELKSTGEPQVFELKGTKVLSRTLRLEKFQQEAPVGWAAISEVQAWGRDALPVAVDLSVLAAGVPAAAPIAELPVGSPLASKACGAPQ